MSLPAWIYSLLFFLSLWSRTLVAQTDGPEDPGSLERRYMAIVEKEQRGLRRAEWVEDLASGTAALVIGFYGYYNDQRGLATKLAYGATQTAGVLMLSSTFGRLNKPNLLLHMDQELTAGQPLDRETYQKWVVDTDEQTHRTEQRQIAYTALILGGIYGYNAIREHQVLALRNVFAFLSVNFLVVSSVNFAQFSHAIPTVSLVPRESPSGSLPNLGLQCGWAYEF